jgi:hypothetical protein
MFNNMLNINEDLETTQTRQLAKDRVGSAIVLREETAFEFEFRDVCTAVRSDVGEETIIMGCVPDPDFKAVLTEEQTPGFAAEVAIRQGKVAEAFDDERRDLGGLPWWYRPWRQSICS